MLKLFLSSDTVVDGGDTLLATRVIPALAPGALSAASTPVTVPVDTSVGVFYIVAQADANGQVTEVNETNNTVAAQLKTGPDLQVTVLNASSEVAAGGVVAIQDTTKNLGSRGRDERRLRARQGQQHEVQSDQDRP